MFKNKYNLIILVLGLVFVLGGCVKKDGKTEVKNDKQPVVVDDQQTIDQSTNIDNSKVENGEIDTSGWLTYRNEEYGFEVKYPSSWNIKKEPAFFDSNDIVGIFIFMNDDMGFFVFPKGEFDRGLGDEKSKIELLINNTKATRQEYDGLSYIKFIDKKNIHKDFRIELNYKNDSDLKNILDNMLQSFKFIK